MKNDKALITQNGAVKVVSETVSNKNEEGSSAMPDTKIPATSPKHPNNAKPPRA